VEHRLEVQDREAIARQEVLVEALLLDLHPQEEVLQAGKDNNIAACKAEKIRRAISYTYDFALFYTSILNLYFNLKTVFLD